MDCPEMTTEECCLGAKRGRTEDGESPDGSVRKGVRFADDVEVVEPERRPESDRVNYRVNDLITLKFHSGLGNSSYESAPTYTHQLFEGETVVLSSPRTPSIEISISLKNMLHQITIGGACRDDEDEIRRRLEPILTTTPLASMTPGVAIDEFRSGEDTFEIRLASHRDAGCSDLLRSCEKLAMWFIETADSVDFQDDRWEVVLVHRKGSINNDSELVGYMTLFTFHNPLVGAKLRICQALVFPGYQMRGIGRGLMRAVYGLCQQRPDVVQVTVEDPAPGFQRLRDAVDTEWYLDHAGGSNGVEGYDKESRCLTKEVFAPVSLTGEIIEHTLKITKQQVRLVLDTLQYCLVFAEDSNAGGSGDNVVPEVKRWRLDLKKRLLKDAPELLLVPKAEMQCELETLYQERIHRIRQIVNNKFIKYLLSGMKVCEGK